MLDVGNGEATRSRAEKPHRPSKPLWTQSTPKLGVTPDKLKQLQKVEFGYGWFFQETTSGALTRRKTKQKQNKTKTSKNKETAKVPVDLKAVGWALSRQFHKGRALLRNSFLSLRC